MKDAATMTGNLKILFLKYLKKKKKSDEFNTSATDHIFSLFLDSRNLKHGVFNALKRLTIEYEREFALFMLLAGVMEESYGP